MAFTHSLSVSRFLQSLALSPSTATHPSRQAALGALARAALRAALAAPLAYPPHRRARARAGAARPRREDPLGAPPAALTWSPPAPAAYRWPLAHLHLHAHRAAYRRRRHAARVPRSRPAARDQRSCCSVRCSVPVVGLPPAPCCVRARRRCGRALFPPQRSASTHMSCGGCVVVTPPGLCPPPRPPMGARGPRVNLGARRTKPPRAQRLPRAHPAVVGLPTAAARSPRPPRARSCRRSTSVCGWSCSRALAALAHPLCQQQHAHPS